MYEPVFSRPLWPAVDMQYIFPACRATGWVYLQSSFINPGLSSAENTQLIGRIPDILLNKDSFAFMGS